MPLDNHVLKGLWGGCALLLLVLALAGAATLNSRATGLPPAPADARTSRILPVVDPLVDGPHAFIALHPDGTPVVPDPCRPMHWTLNRAGLPDGADQQVREAFDFVSAATGLQFVEDASTTEMPSPERPLVQSQRYGDRIAPVLVSFSDSAHIEALGGEVVAVAIPETIETDGPNSRRVATGQVVVDTDFTSRALSSAEGRTRLRMVLMHELGHLVGLDHVQDYNALMAPQASGVLYFGPGDKRGLAVAGSGRCYHDA